MHAFATCFNGHDSINHVQTFRFLAKYGITPALWSFGTEIQEIIVFNINEEL